jgi:hypothetical protein
VSEKKLEGWEAWVLGGAAVHRFPASRLRSFQAFYLLSISEFLDT